jgi:hypothetical protein
VKISTETAIVPRVDCEGQPFRKWLRWKPRRAAWDGD